MPVAKPSLSLPSTWPREPSVLTGAGATALGAGLLNAVWDSSMPPPLLYPESHGGGDGL